MQISAIVSVHQIKKTNNTGKGSRKIKLANSKISAQWQLRKENYISQLYNSVLMSGLSEETGY